MANEVTRGRLLQVYQSIPTYSSVFVESIRGINHEKKSSHGSSVHRKDLGTWSCHRLHLEFTIYTSWILWPW